MKGALSKGTDLPKVRYTVDNISSTVYINDFVVIFDGTITKENGGRGGGKRQLLIMRHGLPSAKQATLL